MELLDSILSTKIMLSVKKTLITVYVDLVTHPALNVQDPTPTNVLTVLLALNTTQENVSKIALTENSQAKMEKSVSVVTISVLVVQDPKPTNVRAARTELY